MKLLNIIAMVSLMLFAGCDAEHMELGDNAKGTVSARLSASRGTSGEGEAMNEVSAYRFYDGILQEVFPSMETDAEGTIHFRPSLMRGNVYFVVNADNILSQQGFQAGVTSEEQFLSVKAETAEMMENGMFMSGSTVITQQTSVAEIALKRALARIDISSPMQGVMVNSVKLKGVSTTGYPMEGAAVNDLHEATTDLVKDYASNPLSMDVDTLFYLPQQEGGGYEVEIMVTSSGAWHRLKTTLPQILRNKIYTLKVYAEGVGFRVEVMEGNWLEGNGSVAGGIQRVSVDMDKSELTDGVVVGEGRDTVFIPSWETDCKITLSAEPGSVASMNGNVSGANVAFSSSVPEGNLCSIEVESFHRMPGTKDEYLYVDVHNGDMLRGRIVLVFKATRVYIAGRVVIDESGTCDFGDYADGELAEMRIPDGKTIGLEFADGNPQWMKLKPAGNTTYRLLGGWRPNDSEADGRVQEGRIVIADNDGSHMEVYTIRRRNWGLPVENVGGTWWCKYNLRGNVKSFADQILVGTDPAKGGSVADYMQGCTDEEFLHVLGGQYQAGNQDELELIHTDSGFMYDGFATKAENFGTLDPKYMAPEGYEVPGFDDFRFFNWGGNSNLGYYNPGVFNNGLGQRLNFIVVERNATFLGREYGPVTFYDFEYQGQHLTLCGLGHQWDANKSIASMNIIFATYGNSGSTWYIEGFSKTDGRGNWFRYGANNNTKTRTIRCIKTPVEYIY